MNRMDKDVDLIYYDSYVACNPMVKNSVQSQDTIAIAHWT